MSLKKAAQNAQGALHALKRVVTVTAFSNRSKDRKLGGPSNMRVYTYLLGELSIVRCSPHHILAFRGCKDQTHQSTVLHQQ